MYVWVNVRAFMEPYVLVYVFVYILRIKRNQEDLASVHSGLFHALEFSAVSLTENRAKRVECVAIQML